MSRRSKTEFRKEEIMTPAEIGQLRHNLSSSASRAWRIFTVRRTGRVRWNASHGHERSSSSSRRGNSCGGGIGGESRTISRERLDLRHGHYAGHLSQVWSGGWPVRRMHRNTGRVRSDDGLRCHGSRVVREIGVTHKGRPKRC
jgi:hypothetical protein